MLNKSSNSPQFPCCLLRDKIKETIYIYDNPNLSSEEDICKLVLMLFKKDTNRKGCRSYFRHYYIAVIFTIATDTAVTCIEQLKFRLISHEML